MKKINIAYIGGGSRGWARTLMNDLAVEPSLSGTVKLYDIDYESALKNEKIGNLYNKAEGTLSTWEYAAVRTLNEALYNADFVIISILPGTFDDMENDVHYPERYGIYQSVGDTVGPGGIMRSIRAVPMYAKIAESIKNECPKAVVISYTNPLTVLTSTLFSVFPEINAFGCCHEVFGTQKLMASMLSVMGIAKNVLKEEIKINVLGINHFTWLDKAEYNGMDIFPIYKEFAEKNYSTGYCAEGKWNDSYFTSANRVKFDLFLQYGLIAAAGDRHLAEFCPGWYLKNPTTAASWKFQLTPVSWRKSDLIDKINKTEGLCNGEEKPVIKTTGEEGVKMIKAICGGGNIISNINTKNIGQHGGMPEGAVVETNANISLAGIEPLKAGRLPRDIENLVLRHVYNQESLVQACLNRDRIGILNVFLNDPLVHLPKADAVELFNAMFNNNLKYFGG